MLKWSESGRYDTATIGHLFVYIEQIEAYKTPDHPDFEPERFEWFIAPDDKDKNYRRALCSGRATTRAVAETDIRQAIESLIAKLHSDLC